MNPLHLNDLLAQWSELEPKVIRETLPLVWEFTTDDDVGTYEYRLTRPSHISSLEKQLQTHITYSGYSLKIHSYSQSRHFVFIGDAVSEQNRKSLLEALLMCWIRFLKWERRGNE